MQEQLEAVQRMQDYIDAHLAENITLSDLSEASMFSPWHAYRLFVHYAGTTPADYIRKLRLSRSALKLRDDSCKVTDVAFEMGFGSVDGYQRAFRREFGLNPGKYAANPVPVRLFTPYGVKYKNTERRPDMKNLKNIFVQLVEKPNRKAIIKRGIRATEYMSYCEEVGCDVWGLCMSIPSPSGEPVCMWLPAAYVKAGTSTYVQGVEVASDYDGIIPDGFDVIDLPAAEYLMFRGEPFAEEDYCNAIVEVQSSIEKYDPSFIGYRRDDSNPRIQLEPIGRRGYIEMIPVKKLSDKA